MLLLIITISLYEDKEIESDLNIEDFLQLVVVEEKEEHLTAWMHWLVWIHNLHWS